jgi:hypothetical protein
LSYLVPKTSQNFLVQNFLFSVSPATIKQKVIKELGKDLVPASGFGPGIRFSFTPDGKTFLYRTAKRRFDIWILEGLRQPSWLDRLRSMVNIGLRKSRKAHKSGTETMVHLQSVPCAGARMLRSCAKAEGFRDSAERPIDGPDLRAMRGDARGNELSIDEADAFGKQAARFEHVSHVCRAYGW